MIMGQRGRASILTREIRTLDLDHLVAVTLEQRSHFGGRLSPQNGRSPNLGVVEMQDRQYSSVPHRVEKRDSLPGPFEWPSLCLSIADDGDRQQVWVVEDRSKGVHQYVAQLTSLVDGSWRGD